MFRSYYLSPLSLLCLFLALHVLKYCILRPHLLAVLYLLLPSIRICSSIATLLKSITCSLTRFPALYRAVRRFLVALNLIGKPTLTPCTQTAYPTTTRNIVPRINNKAHLDRKLPTFCLLLLLFLLLSSLPLFSSIASS